MKKATVLIAIVCFTFNSFGSYRTSVCDLRGTTDTNAVTFKDRIDYCIKENAFKMLRGTILRTAIDQNATFTDAQYEEFLIRATAGRVTEYLIPGFTASSAYISKRTNMTDAEMDNALLYLIWPVCKRIGQGSF